MKQRESELQGGLDRYVDTLALHQPQPARLAFQALQDLLPSHPLTDPQIDRLHSHIQNKLPPEKIRRLRELKERAQRNEERMRVVERGQAAVGAVQLFAREEGEEVEREQRLFLEALQAVAEFEALVPQSQAALDLATLRHQLYSQLLGKVAHALQGSDHAATRLQRLLAHNSLPLKNAETRKEGLPEEDRLFLLSLLYRESCLVAAKQYLRGLLEEGEAGSGEAGRGEGESWVLGAFWRAAVGAVSQLFVDHAQLRNLEEPGWMFEYVQGLLNANYKFLLEFVCVRGLRADIGAAISRHFLAGSYGALLVVAVERRLAADLPLLNEFLLFNWVDELGKLEDKLEGSFGARPQLVEWALLRFDASHNLLQRTLDYEQRWFEGKVFDDFAGIDYSRVNLKNLEAYNLVVHFLSLFERLRRKFARLAHPGLRERVAAFYRAQVLQVVAQVKTSFDRIYHHSRLPKIDVLLGFKRIDHELRAALAPLLAQDPLLEAALHRDYHAFLEGYFEVCALEAVTPTHKKLHISLNEVMDYLCREEEQEHEKYLSGFGRVFEEWAGRVEQARKFAPFVDLKVRAIFFKYLEATNFSAVGLNLYLKIFEPYLRVLLPEDRLHALLALISMPRQQFRDYCDSHQEALAFLTNEERKQLQGFKRAPAFD